MNDRLGPETHIVIVIIARKQQYSVFFFLVWRLKSQELLTASLYT